MSGRSATNEWSTASDQRNSPKTETVDGGCRCDQVHHWEQFMPPVSRHHSSEVSIGQYLINRFQFYGIRDVFNNPGDYVPSFYSMMEQSPINVVGCTCDDFARFAADAYARLNGLGTLCITYFVGGLSVCNSVAGALAEKSPVILISGAPGPSERHNNPNPDASRRKVVYRPRSCPIHGGAATVDVGWEFGDLLRELIDLQFLPRELTILVLT